MQEYLHNKYNIKKKLHVSSIAYIVACSIKSVLI
jgi:hypothetical protein